MPEALKILGQAAPAAATNGDLITVGAGAAQVVSSLVVCNTAATATTFRVHARIAGAAAAVGNAIAYDVPIAGNETITLTLGVTLAATDKLTVRSAGGAVTFTAFGSEVS